MTAKPRWYVAINPGEPEGNQPGCDGLLDAEAPGCGGCWTMAGPPCGGCDACMHAQAIHYGYKVVPVVQVGLETLGDACARVVRETLAIPPKKVYFGVPGHCFDADGEWWHEPGGCKGAVVNCPGGCCGFTLE